jgi:N6-L-threonylcarbamoyladenine synthase
MNILGIETSCDETSAAVVRSGATVLSSVVFSQVDLHRQYGGVVPEVASRCHVETLPTVIREALTRSGLGWEAIDAVAVTYGPGLASSLLVGVSAAKALAVRLGRPLLAVNHLEAHLYSVFLDEDAPRLDSVVPFITLIVSGGHTCLVRVEAAGRYVLLGQTVDDAAGEAFDKGAKLLGLGYPGGPAIDRRAAGGDAAYVRFPRGRQGDDMPRGEGLNPNLCFSFSGLKTALLYYLKKHPLDNDDSRLASLAASYQEAIVDALVSRCEQALGGEQCLTVCGGVSLNRSLRQRLTQMAERLGVRLLLAKPRYCADNAAMVAGAAGLGLCITGDEAMHLDVDPSLPIAHAILNG